jgi:hypothetical protein
MCAQPGSRTIPFCHKKTSFFNFCDGGQQRRKRASLPPLLRRAPAALRRLAGVSAKNNMHFPENHDVAFLPFCKIGLCAAPCKRALAEPTSVETKADTRDDFEAGAQRSRKNVLFLPSILTITSFPLQLRWSTTNAAFGHRVPLTLISAFFDPYPAASVYYIFKKCFKISIRV